MENKKKLKKEELKENSNRAYQLFCLDNVRSWFNYKKHIINRSCFDAFGITWWFNFQTVVCVGASIYGGFLFFFYLLFLFFEISSSSSTLFFCIDKGNHAKYEVINSPYLVVFSPFSIICFFSIFTNIPFFKII